MTRPYTGFFAMCDYRLRYRHFDGSMSAEVSRAAIVSGDASLVLPYDPKTEQILVLEQFRMAPFARGDKNPWLFEPIAGMIDLGETPETCARREAEEEAGSLPLGSQKIVEVCRALVTEPALLLLDEPAAGLGRDDVEQLVEPLRDWVAAHDVSVVIIEHDLELVNNLCEDVAVLHLGTIISRGTPAECMSDPQVVEAYLGAGFAQRS
ncbi:MAG: NUDIX domain-containing protein [Rhodobacteraceae bacterium]|nr:NUDIX domain-containing protein [Paracoccaceae bacterium]